MASGRRNGRGWILAGVIALLFGLAAVIPSPYVIQRPGPVIDALGSIETESGDVEVIRIAGAETFETEGSLNVLSITVSGTAERPASWLSLIGPLLDPSRTIVPLESMFPAGTTSEDRNLQNEVLMDGSQISATAAALRELHQDVSGTVRVVAVTDDGPAYGALEEGDVVMSANGKTVASVAELRLVLEEHGTEAPVTLDIERNGQFVEVAITPVANETGLPVVGIIAATELEFPFDVDLELDRIGGPSAGLIFALAVYDLLTPGALTQGLNVSGTGTIDEVGSIGAIGGLGPKVWAASRENSDLMLIPLANCADLPEQLPQDLTIAPVGTLAEAISAIEDVAEGNVPPGIERCGTLRVTSS